MQTVPFTLQFWTVILGGISTLAIYSFLIRENIIYRLFEHVFIGISAGLSAVLGIRYFLWPTVLVPLLGLDIVVYPDGSRSHEYHSSYLLYILPMLFGLLYYFIYSRKHGWVAKLVIGLSLGASAGLSFKGFFAEMLPQLSGSFKPLVVFNSEGINWVESANNSVFVITILLVMNYFFFSFKVDNAVIRKSHVAGRWLMMVCFGAFFGSTVMARLALLVERIAFLIGDWFNSVKMIFS